VSNPFNFTDRDYVSFRNQMVTFLKDRVPGWSADPSDFAYSMVEGMSYIGDMMSYYVDRAAQESNILTANSPKNVYALARLFGYSPGLAISAWCDVEFTNNGSDAVTLAEGTLVGADSGGLAYELQRELMLQPGQSEAAEVWEGRSQVLDLGVSSGVASQRFLLSEQGVDGRLGALSILTTDPVTGTKEFWTHTELLLDSPAGDYVFAAVVDPDGSTYIQFGDGVAGRVPKKGWHIQVTYRLTEGAAGNAPGSTLSRLLVSWDDPALSSYANVRVVSLSSPSGGRDLESLDSIRSGTVNLTKTQRRAVTAGDYEAITNADSRVLDAVCQTRVWSRPTIWIAPTDRSLYGSPEVLGKLADSVENSLQKVALAGVSPTVRVGNIVDFSVDVEVVAAPSVDVDYVAAAVQEAIYGKYSYENGIFQEIVSADHIIRSISEGVPSTVVQFARVLQFFSDGKISPEVDPGPTGIAVLDTPESVNVTVTKNAASGRTRF
jgi:hypothetical protein